MVVMVNCKCVGVAQTKSKKYRLAWVTDNADMFTTYAGDMTGADFEELSVMEVRSFSVDIGDKPMFLRKEEDANGI